MFTITGSKEKTVMAKTEEIVNSVSRISAGTAIKGDLASSNDLRIDGRFEGRIIYKGRSVIGETSEVSGEIVCTNADIWGKMKGDIYVKDTLSLKKGSKADGNLNIKRIIVELGAAFNGVCKMITEEEFDKKSSALDSELNAGLRSAEPGAAHANSEKRK